MIVKYSYDYGTIWCIKKYWQKCEILLKFVKFTNKYLQYIIISVQYTIMYVKYTNMIILYCTI